MQNECKSILGIMWGDKTIKSAEKKIPNLEAIMALGFILSTLKCKCILYFAGVLFVPRLLEESPKVVGFPLPVIIGERVPKNIHS